MTPKVSVIVPVWNAEKYLRQCLDTIVNQTLREIEVILIDDGSTDASLSVCQKYAEVDKRVSVYTQPNTGAGATRNRGLSLAQGEYLSFLDADDFFELDMLEKMYRKAKATDADIVGCDYYWFDDEIQRDVKSWSVRKENLPKKKVFCAKDCPEAIFYIHFVVWNQLYKREFVLKEKLYYQNLKNSNDVLFLATSLITASKITFLNSYLVHHRKHNDSTIMRREEDWNAPFEAAKALKQFMTDKGLFEKFEVSTLRKIFATMYVCRTLREPVLGIWQNAMVRRMLPNFFHDSDYLSLYDHQIDNFNYLFQKKNLSPLLENFYYNEKDKIVPIVLAVNEKYVPYVAVTIQSVVEHANSSQFYDIYVLHADLSKELQESLEELTHDNVRISCLDISKKTSEVSFYSKDHYSLVMWYRLFIPELFYGYDKVVYLDTDIIVESDIAELFATNLGNAWIGACRAYSLYEHAENTLDLIAENYFNSGVLLFNIPQWQENDLTKKCLELVDSQNKYRFPDQDILNIVCQDHTLILPPYWNCAWYYFEKNTKESWFPKWYEQAFKNVKIIHYSSENKPWNAPKKYLADKWWKYARRSPFYEQILLNNIPQQITQNSIISTKAILMAQKEKLYPDMVKFLKKYFKYFFSFGKKRKMYQKELQGLLLDMFKKV